MEFHIQNYGFFTNITHQGFFLPFSTQSSLIFGNRFEVQLCVCLQCQGDRSFMCLGMLILMRGGMREQRKVKPEEVHQKMTIPLTKLTHSLSGGLLLNFQNGVPSTCRRSLIPDSRWRSDVPFTLVSVTIHSHWSVWQSIHTGQCDNPFTPVINVSDSHQWCKILFTSPSWMSHSHQFFRCSAKIHSHQWYLIHTISFFQ